jgi:lysozyme
MAVNLKGIDVSTWQGVINWPQVKAAGIQFAIVRAGHGTSRDKYWEKNYAGAKAAGIRVGAYWYSEAKSTTGAAAEADKFLTVLKGKVLEFPVYYDIEEKSQFAKGKAFCSSIALTVLKKLTAAGYLAGLYTSTGFTPYFSSEVLRNYPFWCAQYNTRCTYGGPYGIWQHSSKGAVAGISGNVDLDIGYVEYSTEIKSKGLNGFGAAAPAPAPAATPTTTDAPAGTIMELATRTLAGDFGTGKDRRATLGSKYAAVQAEVNHRLMAPAAELAKEVLAGRYGNGDARKAALSSRYQEVQNIINGTVNKKSVSEIAEEVIRGEWGNDPERTAKLKAAGYDPAKVQRLVNAKLKG